MIKFSLKLLALILFTTLYNTAQAQCNDLFFSEYIEGSSSNKAFEIYNPTPNPIDLSDYVIYRNNNGSITPTDSLFPTGTVIPGDVFVVGNPSANSGIMAQVDTTHTMTFYNGDDALWIKKISTGDTLDIIGDIGVDPGSGWPVATGATNNFTLIRQISINQGETFWVLSSTQWDVFPIDMIDSLGAHTMIQCLFFDSLEVISNVSCNGFSDGSAIVAATGGVSPYTYSWSNGDITSIADSLDAGTHYITVTDFFGNAISDSITISEPMALLVNASVDNHVTCNGGNDGAVTVVTSGGSFPYVTSWNNSDSTTSISGLSAGIYSVIVTDSLGCMDSSEVIIVEPAPSMSSFDETACENYTWAQNGTTYTMSGSYQDTIPNVLGCDSVVTLNLTINTVNVSTTQSGISISSDAIGASYQWLDCNNSMNAITGETSQQFTATANGSYAVEVSENGCTDTSNCELITTVGLMENELAEQFVVYPNPTSGLISIEFESVQDYLEVKLISLSSQVLKTYHFENTNVFELEIDQPNGVYFIEMMDLNAKKAVLRVLKN